MGWIQKSCMLPQQHPKCPAGRSPARRRAHQCVWRAGKALQRDGAAAVGALLARGAKLQLCSAVRRSCGLQGNAAVTPPQGGVTAWGHGRTAAPCRRLLHAQCCSCSPDALALRRCGGAGRLHWRRGVPVSMACSSRSELLATSEQELAQLPSRQELPLAISTAGQPA